ncbi:hypothetical protein [Tenacibaculum agarivorans]|uniref:hypothetical protein n=1 Tax=Tenacibaculum agarivorans TaxID=1908389 RepID=UPI00094BA9C5|nr:hypothetical protein [Tenacibaculum agarivorans]
MKIFKLLSILLITIIVSSCSNDDEENNLPETYLTINGDTREIINNGDSELKITKRVVNSTFNLEHSIQLIIEDPNNSLIANFGGYNPNRLGIDFTISEDKVENIKSGIYPTFIFGGVGGNKSFSSFDVGNPYFFNESEQTFNLKINKNRWVVEFKDLEYVGEAGKAIISGRITIDK